jgi:hypothetical protein
MNETPCPKSLLVARIVFAAAGSLLVWSLLESCITHLVAQAGTVFHLG